MRIFISDINDNAPVFPHSVYEIDIDEDKDIGYAVLTATAIDKDEGIGYAFSLLFYIILTEESDFEMMYQTAEIIHLGEGSCFHY